MIKFKKIIIGNLNIIIQISFYCLIYTIQSKLKMKEQIKGSKEEETKKENIKQKGKIAQKSPVLMKKGDYTVHLLIEEVKNLLTKEQDFLPLPVIKASCFNKMKRTQNISTACLEFTYNEHFYFEGVNLSYKELNSQKVIIEVYDSKNTDREDFFGIYEFDLEYIYSSPNHSMKNLWIALANPETKDITQVRGYLKLSISVLNENDERVELIPNPAKESEFMIPPQIKITYQQISIYIFKAEELPDMDNIIGKEKKIDRECNGYIECHYMGSVKQTKVVDMVKEIIKWNEIIDLSVSIPAVSQKINFVVKDFNKITKDSIIGSFEITVQDILENRYENLQDINIYGSPINDTGPIGNKMNTNAEFGSRWKGRLFMMIKKRAVDTPVNGVRPIIDEELLKTVYNTSRSNLWSVYAKLYEAYYLPGKDNKFAIKISMQDSSALFSYTKADNRHIKWNACKQLQCQTLTSSSNELPDLFIYLVNENKDPICFQRIKANLFHMYDGVMMIKLIPDPCIKKVSKLYLSGILKIRIKIFNRAIDKGNLDLSAFKDGDVNQYTTSAGNQIEEDVDEDLETMFTKKTPTENPQIKQLPYKSYTVVANIYMSRYLIPGDLSGTSDPYTQLTVLSQTKETSIKNNCVNGIWNESLVFSNVFFDINEQSTWPVMLVTVMDKDIASSDLLGYNYIWLSDSKFEINNTNTIKPKWHQLYLEKSNRAQGQILLSFYIFDQDHQGLINQINVIPETIPYTVEINALGLRKLKPLSFLPVKKAYVSFDLNSINVTGKKEDALAPIKIQPKDSGENPNLTAVIKFDVKLPKDDVFIPEMQCEVYDHVLGGMINQLLGIFILSIKEIIKDTHYTLEKDEKMTQELLAIPKKNYIDQPIIYPIKGAIIQESELPESEEKLQIESETSLKAPLVNDDEDDDEEILGHPHQMPKPKIHDVSILCTTVADLGNIFKGKIDIDDVIQNKDNPNYFVIKPSFMDYTIPGVKKNDRHFKEFLIEDESNCPPLEYYFPLGFNKETNKTRKDDEFIDKNNEHDKNKKHYRRIYGKELEKVKELGLGSPFTKCKLVRGKYNDIDDTSALFEAIANPNNKIIKSYQYNESQVFKMVSGLINEKEKENDEIIQKNISAAFDLKNYGEFKGLIRIAEKNKLRQHNELIERIKGLNKGKIPIEYDYLTMFEEISRHMLIKKLVIIRVYILELNNLTKKDAFSESDPYIKILIGNEVKVNEKENKIEDMKDCKWYNHYDILTELPGNGSMTIQVFDYDAIFSDELIGETIIDLEDRYFDHHWQDITTKPIEVRKLCNPDYNHSQGEIIMWMEIFDKNNRTHMTPWNIEPEPEGILELRLIVWETENMECMDVEGTSDIYVLAYLDQELRQSTDVHFRCQTGAASFNWRMVIPIKLPRKNYELIFQVYDNDILARDDFICGGKMNLYKLIRDVNRLDVPITFNRDYFNALPQNEKYANMEFLPANEDTDGVKFWVQMVKGENNEKKGRVLCSLELLPKWRADLTKVGNGRDEPNVDPYLPPPVGRFEFSLNPFKMLNQLIGPKFRRKLYCAICCCVFVVYLIIIIPYIIYHVGGELANPFNYIRRKN